MSEVLETAAVQAASQEIAEYNPVAAGLANLRTRLANVSYDLSTVKGMAIAKADRAEVRSLRTGLEAKRKEIKAPALAHCKLIDDEAKRITAELLKLEEPIDEQIKAREAVLEAEKAAREAAEKSRIMAITERIAGIRQYVELAASCRTSERIQLLQDKLAEIKIEGFEEFETEALAAWQQTGEKVEAILTAKLEQEAEQARIKQEQAEAAAKLEAERQAFAAQQAAAKAEADRLAAEHAAKVAADKALADAAAAKAAQEAADRLAQIALEAEAQAAARAAAQAELDRQRAELEAANAAAQAAAEAQRAALAAERAEFEAQQAAAKQAAEQAEAARIEALREIETPPAPESVEAAMAVIDSNRPQAPAEQAPDAIEDEPIWLDKVIPAPEPASPSDAEIIWSAISALCHNFQMTQEQALARLAAIQDWTL